ncbi:MAG: cation transporter [Firmicutes bacterium]|nr:cation transporter [Bacillota bacterium]
MDFVSKALLRKFVGDYGDTQDPGVRRAYGYLEAWVGILGNVLLAGLNAALGLMLNSISLLAQSVHTAADVVTSVIVLAGFAAASRPPDEQHPHGHGRVETMASLVIAILLAIVGFEFASKAVGRIIGGAVVKGNPGVVAVLLAVGLAKEWMARFSISLGRAIGSPALEADAWHHRSDAVASALSSVSIASAVAGYPKVDAALGVAVSVLIAYTGVKLGWSSASVLMGERPDPELASAVDEVVRSVDGVKDMHRFVLHDYGATKVGSVHIQVAPDLNVKESHSIAGAVRRRLREEFSIDCVVHVEPGAEP